MPPQSQSIGKESPHASVRRDTSLVIATPPRPLPPQPVVRSSSIAGPAGAMNGGRAGGAIRSTPLVIYVTFRAPDNSYIKRITKYYRHKYNGRPLYMGKDGFTYYDAEESRWVISKVSPLRGQPAIVAHARGDTDMPPEDGWVHAAAPDEVTVQHTRPLDWVEEEEAEEAKNRARLARFLAALKKNPTDAGDIDVTIRDIVLHMTEARRDLPELLRYFPQVDQDGNGKLSLEELEQFICPKRRRDFDSEMLDEIWKQLISGRTERLPDWMPEDQVYLEDLARHYDYVNKVVPDLIENFKEVDLGRTCSIMRDEFDSFFGNPDVWLQHRLRHIIGVEPLKDQLRKFYWAVRLDRLRRRNGLHVRNEEAIVLLFKGSPGTGKTTIGRLITGLLHRIGVIPKDTFLEVQRDELVGDHIGHTEQRTEEVVKKSHGGVLFVDEAYRLNSDIFGVEAVQILMRAMTVKGKVIIIAGYPKQMDDFVSLNPGLKRRITYEFDFPDYTTDELGEILFTQVQARGFQVDPSVSVEDASRLIASSTTREQRAAFNGGVGEHITRHAIFALNEKEMPLISASEPGQEPVPSVVLGREELAHGCSRVPQPPPKCW